MGASSSISMLQLIIDDKLTALGGGNKSDFTKELFTLGQDRWLKRYPPMNTKRFYPAIVSTLDGNYLLVIGGSVHDGWTVAVELFHMRSKRWYELTNLPWALSLPSAIICGNQLHAIGHDRAGYSCSLQTLLSSDQPQSIRNILKWTPLPRQPVE